MTWASIRLGIPVGFLGGLVAVGAFIGIKGEGFSIFDLEQLSRMVSLYFGGFITTLVPFLIGLKTTPPEKIWDGHTERRNGSRRVGDPLCDTNKLT